MFQHHPDSDIFQFKIKESSFHIQAASHSERARKFKQTVKDMGHDSRSLRRRVDGPIG